ncbi:MAG: septal ring lytic transglycosylase RlpA family protein [Rubrobacteraceae bacterium]
MAVAVAGCLALFVFASAVVKAEQMVASWYGPGFEGNLTANGEIYDPYGYTAASKTYEFGTRLIVTYEGRSVVVDVNDRGPYVAGRDLDLSQGAAEYIGLTAVGVGTVDVEVAAAGTPTGPYGGTKEVRRPAPNAQLAQQPEAPVQDAPEAPVADEAAGTNQQRKAPQESADITGDQYASTDQYTEEIVVEEAVPPAPPAPKPEVPVLPPEPAPAELEAPPAELVVPNSTIERRVVLEVAAPPEPAPEPVVEEEPEPVLQEKPQAKEPEPVVQEEPQVEEPEPVVQEEPQAEEPEPVAKEESKAKEPEAEKSEAPGGITELPDTGGAPVGFLLGGGALLGAGIAVRIPRR